MTPEVRAQLARNDAALSAIGATLERLEAKKQIRDSDLLREVSEHAEADPSFKTALIWLIVD